MSKKCRNCGCSEIDQTGRYVDGSVSYKCRKCGTHFMLFTVFKTITSSPEVLAEKLVVEYRHGVKDYAYYSTVTCELYNTKAEAIAATVAKLKEVANE